MNPLRDLPRDFDKLTEHQVFQVIQAYCDENRYEYEKPDDTRITAKEYFESQYANIQELINYFNEWQH